MSTSLYTVGSDHRGISPQELNVDASGLAALLRRSKTIGSDKSIVSRPLELDGSCFVKERIWLLTGWRVVHEAASFERDYLLPAPSVNLRCCRRAELKYDQGYALQHRAASNHELLDSSFEQGVHANGDSSVGLPEKRTGLPQRVAGAGERPLRQDRSQKDRQHAANSCTRDQDKERWSAR